MDQLLRKENLDLKLTPYKVLATGADSGFVQWIDSKPLASVLNERGSIQSYLFPDGENSNVMDTYLKSCGKENIYQK